MEIPVISHVAPPLITSFDYKTDNGSYFGARLFTDEINRFGIELTNAVYRSYQDNAIAERFFKTLTNRVGAITLI